MPSEIISSSSHSSIFPHHPIYWFGLINARWELRFLNITSSSHASVQKFPHENLFWKGWKKSFASLNIQCFLLEIGKLCEWGLCRYTKYTRRLRDLPKLSPTRISLDIGKLIKLAILISNREEKEKKFRFEIFFRTFLHLWNWNN